MLLHKGYHWVYHRDHIVETVSRRGEEALTVVEKQKRKRDATCTLDSLTYNFNISSVNAHQSQTTAELRRM